MTNITEATFNDRLSSAVATDGSLADECQALIVFGINFYKGKAHRACYLDKIMNANFRASRREAMRKYIMAHTNLKLIADKQNAGMHVFVKDVKSKVKTFAVDLPKKDDGSVKTWYEFTPEAITVAFDIDSRLKSLINATKAAIDGTGKAKIKGPSGHAKEILKGLEALAA